MINKAYILGICVKEYLLPDNTIKVNELVSIEHTEWLTKEFARHYSNKFTSITSTFRINLNKRGLLNEIAALKNFKNSAIVLIYNGIGQISQFDKPDYDGQTNKIEKYEGIQMYDDVIWDREFNNLIANFDQTNHIYLVIDACYAGGLTPRADPYHKIAQIITWKKVSAKLLAFYACEQERQIGGNDLMYFFQQIFPLIYNKRKGLVGNIKGLKSIINYFNSNNNCTIHIKSYNSFDKYYYF